MTNKQILIVFLIGAILTIVGAIFKILKFPLASFLLIVGMTFEASAGVLIIYKLSRKNQKNKGFLDS